MHPNGQDAATSDSVWVADCHPSASAAGFGIDGLHINMCDTFDGYQFTVDDAHQRGGGYTLAHEFGHYYFGLYDEYVGEKSYDTNFSFPHSTDTAVPNSAMNSQWMAVNGDLQWLNFSTARNDTTANAQHRVMVPAPGQPSYARWHRTHAMANAWRCGCGSIMTGWSTWRRLQTKTLP